MVASSSEPVLTSAELDDLLVLAKRPDADGNLPYLPWRAQTAYGVDDVVVPDPRNGHLYKVTGAGTTGNAQPAWPLATGATVVDGTVTWQEAGLAPWTPTFDLNAAAAEGWRWKAGKVAAVYSYSIEGQSAQRAQMHAQCLEQAARYAKRVIRSVPVRAAGISPTQW